ncbi:MULTISPECIES: hypothetical protein [Lactobacillus]|uniref:Uncharacterized protein n=1 Tax=Lactobacillus delbrueckii TaxID=1584 RepID=A0ABD0AI97_9LACO|nr:MULTISPECIES: hypothetical protein [Lactobacillus]GHN19432.1 hypothetical protein ME783_19740 [Lactobacillus delbrueckii]GHN20596.1 hypothetical protein ME784_11110 [Lactobacillus delbrueckii]GHN22262.1 hypothetical protein ME785_08200 [Lactobacillus delbrueckii]GHN34848.1 hypothetical protein ME791_20000 [Lactobacillus delbrueckii]GHN42597.1 hypothetical protein ME796_19460 [Lactobacillus delbrueckii]
MNIISSLLSKYPADQVTPQDFIDKLTIGNPGWQSAYLAVRHFRPAGLHHPDLPH